MAMFFHRSLFSIVSLLFCLHLWCSAAFADLIKQGNGLIYDTALDITWHIDSTQTKSTWNEASTWADELSFAGFDDWRLPSTPDGTWGFTSDNSNIYNVTTSEMGHLFHETLGNHSKYNASGTPQSDFGLANTSYLVELQAGYYWFGTTTSLGNLGLESAWIFDFAHGSHIIATTNNSAYRIAVRDGSSQHSVPEPATAGLLLTGFLLLKRRLRN